MAAMSALAGEFNVSIDQTVHIGSIGKYNDTHPMVEYETDTGWIVGAYYNSERRLSAFGGKRFYTENRKFSVDFGLVTGYKAAPVLPGMQVQYHINKNFKLFALPGAETGKGGKGTNFFPIVGVRYVF
jgi:hypothetical protein